MGVDITEADITDDVPSSSRQLSSWLRRTRQNKVRKVAAGWGFRRGCVGDTDHFHQPSCLWLKNWRNFILVGFIQIIKAVCVYVLFLVSMFWVFLATPSTPNCSWGASRGVPSRWYHAWSFRRCWSSLDLGRLNDQKGAILDGFLPFQIYIRGRPNKRMWWWIFGLG